MRATTAVLKKNKENQKYPSAGCIVCTQQHRQTKAVKKRVWVGKKKVLTKQPEVVFCAVGDTTGDELSAREGSICRFSNFTKVMNKQRSKTMGAIRAVFFFIFVEDWLWSASRSGRGNLKDVQLL